MKRILFAISCALMLGTSAFAGSIIVNSDEWPLSNTGYSTAGASNAGTFATNAASFLTGGSGSILIYSNNGGLDQSNLQTSLTGAGYSVTEDTALATTFNLPTLSAYKAIFLGGDALTAGQLTVLSSYLAAGGGIYIAAGTGFTSAAAEAAQWNVILNPNGLSLASVYNGISGNILVSSASPVLAGVTQLYYNDGNTVSSIGPGGTVITSEPQSGAGLIGISGGATTPEPSTSALVAAGLFAAGFYRNRRTRKS
jgi:hypothetical protein